MRIVFDNIIYSLQRYGGISVVWNNLVSRIVASGHDVQFMEYSNADVNISRRVLNLPGKRIERVGSFMMPIRRYFNPHLSARLTHQDTLQSDKHYIFHSSYFRLSDDPNAINITTVHDFTYEMFVHNWVKRTLHCRQKHAAIRNADRVVCISENTRRDLLRILPDVDPAKVSVIYNGVESGKFHVIPDMRHEDFAIFVGRRDDYKNFLSILKPLANLGIRLCIVGSPLTRLELDQLAQSGIDYQYCGLVSYEELNRLYNQALFLFYPSRYEGFGLPVLEAQMAGCPVLAFNASAIPEVIGDPTLMLDELTTEAIAPQIQRFRDPQSRARIVAEGLANASRFSWDKMAAQYLQLYQNAFDERAQKRL